jgi:hypothetical protein
MNNTSKLSTKYRSLAAGIASQLSGVKNVKLENTSYATKDLAKLFTSVAKALDANPPLKAAWLSSARSSAATEEKAHPVMVAFVRWARATFGKEPAIMQAFGLAAPAPHPATVATKAQAQVKAATTRQADGTKKKGSQAAATAATEAPASSAPPKTSGS